jgi:hypothetical protein
MAESQSSNGNREFRRQSTRLAAYNPIHSSEISALYYVKTVKKNVRVYDNKDVNGAKAIVVKKRDWFAKEKQVVVIEMVPRTLINQ